MDLSGIISISGRSGLFKVIAQSKNTIIVESLIDGKKIPAYSSDRISALQDISIYTYEEDVPLKDIYQSMAEKLACKPCISHKESANKLTKSLEEFLPNFDKERVYPSDVKKLFQWYNILQKANLINLEEANDEKEEVTKETKAKATNSTKTTAAKKEVATKKTTVPKKSSANTGNKQSGAKKTSAAAKKTTVKANTKNTTNK